jgi:hypothetical protein
MHTTTPASTPASTPGSTPASTPGSTPTYPIGRPAGHDARFCCGLALDVATVLHRYGYPAARTGADLLRVQQALFNLIYQEKTP